MRIHLIMLLCVTLQSCTTYPVIKDFCPELGRALTDEERILKGLEFFYDADERLLRNFPKGTKSSDYWVPAQLDARTKTLKPPFVPKHFQAEKRAAQVRNASLDRDAFSKVYYKQFPGCCEVVEPAYRRGKQNSFTLNTTEFPESSEYIKDVWVRQKYPFKKNESVFARGELSSYICGVVSSHVADRG